MPAAVRLGKNRTPIGNIVAGFMEVGLEAADRDIGSGDVAAP
jgi:hypothetical protein